MNTVHNVDVVSVLACSFYAGVDLLHNFVNMHIPPEVDVPLTNGMTRILETMRARCQFCRAR